MADKVRFELVSPERVLYSSSAEMVVVPGAEGDFGVLAGHQPIISLLRPGSVDIYDGDKITDRVFVAGGFAEMSGDRLTILVGQATPFAEVDRAGLPSRIADARRAHQNAGEDSDATANFLAYLEHMSEITTLS